jgi:hypothetical protein
MNSENRGWRPAIGHRAWLALGMNALSCLGSGLTMPFLIVYLHGLAVCCAVTSGLALLLGRITPGRADGLAGGGVEEGADGEDLAHLR